MIWLRPFIYFVIVKAAFTYLFYGGIAVLPAALIALTLHLVELGLYQTIPARRALMFPRTTTGMLQAFFPSYLVAVVLGTLASILILYAFAGDFYRRELRGWFGGFNMDNAIALLITVAILLFASLCITAWAVGRQLRTP